MATVKTEAEYKQYFSGSFKGMSSIIDDVLSPIFGKFTWKTSPTDKDYVKDYGNGGANIDSIFDYGYFDTNGTNVSVWEIVLADNCHISIARKNIQNTVRQITKTYSGAFIVFRYSDGSTNTEAKTWRLSWLKRLDVHRKDSPAKRYTYLCGPSYSCRTIAQRFDELQKTSNKTLDSITKAFDVEALSDEFFKEYKVMYDDIVQWITGQRIIKKDGKWKLEGHFGTGLGNSVLDEFKKKISNDEGVVTKAVRDYVKKLLGRLVFIQFLQKKEWLKIDGTISTNFLLDLFNVIDEKSQDNFIEAALERVVYLLLNNENREKNSEIIDLHKLDVPFLNGGLFERDQYDNLEIKLPKEFFHNETYKEEKRELSETRLRDSDNFFTQCGILDLFNQYNFTIDENDPNDAELGVDPEMLGKIFENLLEDNKDKGAFYTPKEIVQYMCNESLIAYLQTKVPNNDNKIRQFVLNAEQKDVPEKEKILNALQEVKICDPAIGSGAFPMELLNLLVALREKLESSSQRVELKKSIIKNNIYGVDIEKGAIDIARLRFWLSIMVDEAKPIPLPNFDYKFMQGNSLLECYNGVELNLMKPSVGSMDFAAAARNDLQVLLQKYFDCTDHLDKTNLQKDIEDKIKEILILQSYTIDLSSIDLSGNDKFFLWHTWFADVFKNGGFDIAIGNPPYFLYQENHVGEIGELRKIKEYEIAFGGKLNAYKLFIANALTILCKKNGVMCVICQNSLLADRQATNLRKYILSQNQFISIDSFPERDNKKKRVFESVKMSVCIPIVRKQYGNDYFKVQIWDDKNKTTGLQTRFNFNEIESMDSKEYVIPRLKSEYTPIVIQMINRKKIDLKCYEGELNMTNHKKYFTKNQSNPKILKGAAIQRYYYTLQMSQGEIEYLNEKEYLKDFGTSEKSNHHNYSRIVMQGMTGANDKTRIVMSIVPKGYYLANSCNYVFAPESYVLESLLGILNSRLINWYFRCFSTNSNVNGYEIDNLPIPNISTKCKSIIESLVVRILDSKKSNSKSDTTVLESKIDILVYLLYNLTWDEMQIVESTSVNPIYIDKTTYEGWVKNYNKGKGTLPSEADMESAIRASFAYTNCTSSPYIDLTTEEIMTLAQIDHFTDYGFQGINCMDDKHKQIEVILKNKKIKKVESKITIAEALKRIEKIEKQLKKMEDDEKKRRNKLEKDIEKAKKDFAKKQDALKNKKNSLEDDSEDENDEETIDQNLLQEKKRQLLGEFERDLAKIKAKRAALEKEKKELEDEIAKHKGDPANTEITVIRNVSILGEYYRAESQIILYLETIRKSTFPSYKLFQTYIHEMFHAYYDANPTGPDYYREKVEEPITELGALTFIEKFTGKNKDKEFMDFAVAQVEKKQFNPAICHYGFGTYLFKKDKGLVQQYYDNRSKIVNPSSDLTAYEDMFRIAYPASESDCYENLKKVLGI